jgi:outer membrane receptor for ferric coprogen and ferric-rhodotorulic acid
MNIIRSSSVCGASLVGLLAALSFYGVTTRAAESTAKSDEPIVLSPFEVRTDVDQGFVASSSLAGGRLATDLKDTPVAYSVLTRDVMDVLNLNSLTDLAITR